ncbi:MAG: hypothetical protein ACHP8A_10925 [Terriglobales bacterium]
MHDPVVAEQLPRSFKTAISRGTVDVVISTTEGFVLATDSRLTVTTDSGTIHRDDAQKLFPVGKQTACVVAGLQASRVGSGVLRPANAIGTTLLSLDRLAFTNRMTADNIATSYYFAMKQIGELGDWPRDEIDQIGELSLVSVNVDGTSDWISLSVPLTATDKNAGGPLSARAPTYSIRETGRPLHFGFGVIGQREIANRLLGDNRSERDKHSRSCIMTRYYRLKRAGQLDQLTLIEGIILARELIQATIDSAPQSAGVGGPIDIATVTKTGFHWIQRKCGVATLPTPLIRVTNSSFGHSPLVLDKLQCLNCDFTDAHLLYAGTGDVQLLNCKFGGSCLLVITPDAKRRRPETVEALRKLIGSQCAQLEQESNYP